MSGRPRTTSFAEGTKHTPNPPLPGLKITSKGGSETEVVTVLASPGQMGSDRPQEISYTAEKIIGNGSFGVVYQANLCETGELIAIKRVLQDKRFKNRELQIMRRLEHCNIVKLKYFYYCCGETNDEVFLNLVLEYMPETVYRVARYHSKYKINMPISSIQLYMYQLFRSLAYIHALGICHRDIKPQNLLLNIATGVLKLCDFGSAKHLVKGEPNVSYICSRYYRAPELIFGATHYTTKIDMWSAGCVMAELLLGQPIFPGDSGVDQLVEIIKVLGTPTREQIHEMNPSYTEFKFPLIKSHPWYKLSLERMSQPFAQAKQQPIRVFRSSAPTEALVLITKLLAYTPKARLSPLKALTFKFFDDLRVKGTTLPSGQELPPLFNFTEKELSSEPELKSELIPTWLNESSSSEKTDAGKGESSTSAEPQASGGAAAVPTTTAPAATTPAAAAPATAGSSQQKPAAEDAIPAADTRPQKVPTPPQEN